MKNKNVAIRKYERKDKNNLEDLMQQDQEYHIKGDPDFFVPVKEYFNDDYYEDLADEELMFAYVAETEDTLVGCLICVYEDVFSHDQIYQKNMIIAEIYVRDDYKRQGIATALFEAVKQRAKDELIDFVTLDVYSFNTQAQEFYRHIGMTTYKQSMNYLITPKSDPEHIATTTFLKHMMFHSLR